MSALDPDYTGVRTLRIVLAFPFDEDLIKPIFDSLKLCLKTELLVFKEDVPHFGISKDNYVLAIGNEDCRKLKLVSYTGDACHLHTYVDMAMAASTHIIVMKQKAARKKNC